jgi:arabinofuranan 3-O-arabinosyltransferase
VLPLGLAYGVWVAGAVGAALVAVILVCMWWLGRQAPQRLRHAKPGRPSMGGRTLPLLAGPWPVAVSLALAGLAMGAGTYLALYMPFHEVTEVFGGALRGWVSQLLCLPALARLVLALGQPGDGEDAEADPPSVRARAAAANAGGGGANGSAPSGGAAGTTDVDGGAVVVGAGKATGAHAVPERQGIAVVKASGTGGVREERGPDTADTEGNSEANGAAGAHTAPEGHGSDGAGVNGSNGATGTPATPVSDEADGAPRDGGPSDDDRWENDPEEART